MVTWNDYTVRYLAALIIFRPVSNRLTLLRVKITIRKAWWLVFYKYFESKNLASAADYMVALDWVGGARPKC
jgi:hypothetical protein